MPQPSVLLPPQPSASRPRPAQHARPEKLPWSFITFLKWPARVFNPPKAPEVRGWSRKLALLSPNQLILTFVTVIPTLHITLEDMLKQKHLPPVSLKDFEEYLL